MLVLRAVQLLADICCDSACICCDYLCNARDLELKRHPFKVEVYDTTKTKVVKTHTIRGNTREEVKRRMKEWYPNTKVRVGYGLSMKKPKLEKLCECCDRPIMRCDCV